MQFKGSILFLCDLYKAAENDSEDNSCVNLLLLEWM
jgi:hypothetical protein